MRFSSKHLVAKSRCDLVMSRPDLVFLYCALSVSSFRSISAKGGETEGVGAGVGAGGVTLGEDRELLDVDRLPDVIVGGAVLITGVAVVPVIPVVGTFSCWASLDGGGVTTEEGFPSGG